MCSRRKKTKNTKAGLCLLMPYQIAAPSWFLFNVTVSAFRESTVDVFADQLLQLVIG